MAENRFRVRKSKVEDILFDTTITPIDQVEGLMQWNETDGTLDLTLQGGTVTQQIGQELLVKCRNDSDAPIENGTPVYISGRQGNRPKIFPARSDVHGTAYVFGVATENIADNSDGYVTTFGYVRQIKTNYSGTGVWGSTWQESDNLYVSKTISGQLTNVEPDPPHHSDVVGQVGVVGSAGVGSIFINIRHHTAIEELSDVNGTPLTTNGQLMVWDNDSGYFDFDYNINDYATTGDLSSYATIDYVTGISGDLQSQIDTLDGATGDYVLKSETGSAATLASGVLLDRANHTGTQTLSTISDAGTIASFNSGDFVDVYNNQTINGEKTFASDIYAQSNAFVGTDLTVSGNGFVSGYFGINTSNPTDPFHLVGAAGAVTMSGNYIRFSRNAGNYIQAPNGLLSFAAGGTSNSYSTNIGNNGNVTIGSAQGNDGYKLSVNGDGRFTTDLEIGNDLTVTGNTYVTGNIGAGISAPSGNLHIVKAGANTYPSPAVTSLIIEDRDTAGNYHGIQLFSDNADAGGIMFGDEQVANEAFFGFDHLSPNYNHFTWEIGGIQRMSLASSGLAIGKPIPEYTLHVTGDGCFGTDLTVSGNSYITGSLDVDTSATIGTNLTVGDKLTVGTTLASNVGYFYLQDNTPYTASAVQLQQDATVRVFNPSTTANTVAGILLGNRLTSTTWCGMLSITPSANNAELAFVIEDSDTITEMVRINEVGLGVNQTNPSYALDIVGDGNFTTSLGVGTDLTVSGNSYITGNLGVGTSSPSAKIHSLSTSEQLRLGYDASNYLSFTVDSAGELDVDSTNGEIRFNSSAFIFEDSANHGTRATLSSNDLYLGFGASDAIVIEQGGPYVAIRGTPSASYDFEVFGTSYTQGDADFDANVNITSALDVGTNCSIGGHLSAATKSFLIDNPTKEGKKLQYGVVESDQHSVFVRGKTDQKIIELPEEWEWLVHEDSVTVQLTPVGKSQQLYIIEQNNKIVHVGGVEGEFNYTIYGERKDVAKLETEV